MVISADPSHLPYSVLILYHMLSQEQQVLGTCLTHSSVSNLPASLRNVFGAVEAQDRGQHKLGLTLVWKRGEEVRP